MSDAAVFNLIEEPWLPVRRRSGAVERIAPWSITDCIADDPFTRFAWPRPDFNGAAHEFLIGLLSTAAAAADDDEWEDWWSAPPNAAELRRKFSRVAHAFDLDGPGPRFLQDSEPLDAAERKSVTGLLMDAPGAETLRNNADLFVKRSERLVVGRAAAAMALFALSSYAPSGGAGHRTSLRGGGPLTTLIVARHREHRETLWGRLWPNVETREQIEERAVTLPSGDATRIFPWLAPTRTSNPKAGGAPTTAEDVDPRHVYWGMPRRIRLLFEPADQRRCDLTGLEDRVVVAEYRTRNYGADYTEGFQHPLTPYYRQNAKSVVWLPRHPRPGGISYRLWPGLVVPDKSGLRLPARVVRKWRQERRRCASGARFVAFGYDMDKMKARAWVEGEMPLRNLEDPAGIGPVEDFICCAISGAASVAGLVVRAVKAALYDRPRDASGDYGFVAERFFRDTEAEFYVALEDATVEIERQPDIDDPTVAARTRWASVVKRAAMRLFDEYAPSEGLEHGDMLRHVRAWYFLSLALAGRGRDGRALFSDGFQIPVAAAGEIPKRGEQAT